jgi:hypothetical protein
MRPVEAIGSIRSNREDDLLIVASSFERERSVASARRFKYYRARCTMLITTRGDSGSRGERQKLGSVNELLEILGRADVGHFPRQIVTPGYDPIDLTRQIRDELEGRGIPFEGLAVTLDMSCLTKLQLITLLRLLLRPGVCSILRLLYTYPERYNTGGWERAGRLTIEYSKPLIFPIQGSFLRNRRVRRRLAIVVLGHEGPRALAAWRAAEADFTWLVEARSERPEVMDVCRNENRFLYGLVQDMGEPSCVIETPNMGLAEICGAMRVALEQAEYAEGLNEVSLIPYGPKAILAGVLLAVLSRSELSAEVVYAVCKRYNSDYSSGVEGVYAVEIQPDVAEHMALE